MAEKSRDIKRRIRAVESTRKVTHAMHLIAATRISRAQVRTERSRPFAKTLGDMIEMLAGEAQQSALLAEREQIRTVGLIVITGDRGLAGAYNSNVLREAQRAMAREQELGREVRVTAVGRKGVGVFRFRRIRAQQEFTGMSDKPRYADAQRIAQQVISDYVSGDVDKVLLAYTDFVSISLQRARVAQILPVPHDEHTSESEGPKAQFEFEPEPAELLNALLPRYVEIKVFAALLESSTSEHAARMRAMKAATDKAEELIDLYRLRANKARQAEITTELSDIVGATVALQDAK